MNNIKVGFTRKKIINEVNKQVVNFNSKFNQLILVIALIMLPINIYFERYRLIPIYIVFLIAVYNYFKLVKKKRFVFSILQQIITVSLMVFFLVIFGYLERGIMLLYIPLFLFLFMTALVIKQEKIIPYYILNILLLLIGYFKEELGICALINQNPAVTSQNNYYLAFNIGGTIIMSMFLMFFISKILERIEVLQKIYERLNNFQTKDNSMRNKASYSQRFKLDSNSDTMNLSKEETHSFFKKIKEE